MAGKKQCGENPMSELTGTAMPDSLFFYATRIAEVLSGNRDVMGATPIGSTTVKGQP